MSPLAETITTWIARIWTIDFAIQLGAIAIAIVIARLAKLLTARRITGLEGYLEKTAVGKNLPWSLKVIPILQMTLFPVLVSVMMRIASEVLVNLELANDFVEQVIPFVGIWLLYRAIVGFVYATMPDAQAHVWQRQILRPTFIAIGGLQVLGLWDDFLELGIQPSRDILITIRSLFLTLFVMFVFFRLSRFLRSFLKDTFLPRAGVDPVLGQIISTLSSYVVSIAGIILGLQILGLDLTLLTVIIGGLSVGVGFGLQDLTRDFISGFILLFERAIGPGDIVEVSGTAGVVQDIGLRSMHIATLDNVNLIVPNGNFLSEIVTNYSSHDPKVRIFIEVGVSYESDPQEIRRLLLQAAEHPRVLKDPEPDVLFIGYGESSLDFALRVWTEDTDWIRETSSDIRFTIWDVLKANNVVIPFPQRDLHVKSIEPVAAYLDSRNGR